MGTSNRNRMELVRVVRHTCYKLEVDKQSLIYVYTIDDEVPNELIAQIEAI